LGGSSISKEPPVQILFQYFKIKEPLVQVISKPPTIDGFRERMGSLASALTF
jgi:hypothetical protein